LRVSSISVSRFLANIVFAIERRVVGEVEVVARYAVEHADWV